MMQNGMGVQAGPPPERVPGLAEVRWWRPMTARRRERSLLAVLTAPTHPTTGAGAAPSEGERREHDQPALSLRGLRRSYGSFEAVRGIDLEIARGEIFALLV